jgi:hypothetical protein
MPGRNLIVAYKIKLKTNDLLHPHISIRAVLDNHYYKKRIPDLVRLIFNEINLSNERVAKLHIKNMDRHNLFLAGSVLIH